MNSFIFLVLSLLLTACAASKSVRHAEDIVDDGKRNSLLLSFDIRLDSHDRYPGVNSTELALRCGPHKSLNPYPVCFYIKVPFQGKRDDNGYIVNSFDHSGTRIYQIKYGRYSLARTGHSVVVDQRRDRTCYPTKKHRHRRCYDEYVDVKADFVANLPLTTDFDISEGNGCYLGHIKLHMRGNKIVNYEIDTTYSEDIFDQLPESTRERARSHITASCVDAPG